MLSGSQLTKTSNMTRGPKGKCSFVCRYVAPPGECYYNTLLRCKDYFLSPSVVSRAFSALCMYSQFRHHPSSFPRLPLCQISFLSRPPLLS